MYHLYTLATHKESHAFFILRYVMATYTDMNRGSTSFFVIAA